jgi:hypothetical protein
LIQWARGEAVKTMTSATSSAVPRRPIGKPWRTIFGIFWPLCFGRLRAVIGEWDNRRMTDAAHNQHSETRRPSDHDRIVTTGPSRFQAAGPEVLR